MVYFILVNYNHKNQIILRRQDKQYQLNKLYQSNRLLLVQLLQLLYQSIRQMSQSTVFFWGNNQHNLLSPNPTKTFHRPQRLPVPYDILDISSSEKHICFITQDGTLLSFGLNLDGRLGVGGKPDLKCGLTNPIKVKLASRAVKVKCGFSHVCAQLANDELYSWGLGDYGALGTGEFKSRGIPGKVMLKGRITNFSCGAMHSGFVDSQGSIFTCGSNQYGELGVNRPEKIATPILINFAQKVKQIECGVFYTLLLTAKGQVFGMGNNKYGQLGIGHKVNECHPTLVRQLEGITSIAAGYHSGAIDGDGALYIWGSGSFGQLLKPKKILLPTPIDQLFIRGFFGVAVSNRHQRVYAWGNNTYGQLGRGNYESAKDPVEVNDLASIRFNGFACGVNFFLAITNDHNLPREHKQSVSEDQSRNRYRYLAEERRSPYNYGVGSHTPTIPLNLQTAVFNEDQRSRSIERTARTPARFEKQIQDAAKLRSRSRSRGEQTEVKELIAQQIKRSRNRKQKNYEELFISLSADYQTLLARFKAMEEHLQLKNRSLIAQRQEISLLFKEQNDYLKGENEILKRQLSATTEQLQIQICKPANIPAPIGVAEDTLGLTKELTQLKEQLKATLKKLIVAEQKNKSTFSDSQQISRLQESFRQQNDKKDQQIFKLQQRLRVVENLRDQQVNKNKENIKIQQTLKETNSQLNRQVKTLKEQFKITIKQLQTLQQDLTTKQTECKQYRIKAAQKDANYVPTKQLQTALKDLKVTKDQLKTTTRRFQQTSQQLAIKSLELKDIKQKRSGIQFKEQLEEAKANIIELGKDNKNLKEQLKAAGRKYDIIEQELAIKSIQLKDLKQRKQSQQSEFKHQQQIISEEITYIGKQLKVTKDQLKITLRKLDAVQEELAVKNIELKESKQKQSYSSQQLKTEILAQRDDILLLTKDNKSLKEELRNCNRRVDQLQQELETKITEIKDIRTKLASKDAQIQGYKTESVAQSKDIRQLKDQLKKTLRDLDKSQQQVATKIVQLRQFKSKKDEQHKIIEKKCALAQGDLQNATNELRFSKDQVKKSKEQNRSLLNKMESLTSDLGESKTKQKFLAQSLKESNKSLSQKQKILSQFTANQKKVQNQLYKTIATLQQQKTKLLEDNQSNFYQKKQAEQALRVNQDALLALQRQHQLELGDAINNLIKLKEIQDLNEIRAGELKNIIEDQQSIKHQVSSQLQLVKIKLEQAQQEKKQLFKMIEEHKNRQEQDLQIYKDKIIEAQNQTSVYQQKISHMEVELNYQKDYHSKCQDTIKDLSDNRDKACRELEITKQDLQKEKEKVKELGFQAEKGKAFKKEVEVLNLQLERVQASTKQYRKQIEQILIQKQQVIKELRGDFEKKQIELQKLEQRYQKDTNSLNREVKDYQKKLSVKTKEYSDLKKEIERKIGEIDSLKETIDKASRKLSFKNEQFDKQVKEHEKTTEQFNHLRRQYAKLKSQKEDFQNKNDQLVHEKENLEQRINERKRQIQMMQSEVRRLQTNIQNIKKETELVKKELQQSNWALQQSNKVNDQLTRANKEFAQNQEQFTSKIAQLQGQVFQLQDENKSYSPRYEALLQRNRQLDERNKELAQMINKAIEIQAEAYKTNILKQVEINTGEIIQQIKEEQQYKPRSRRRQVPQPKETDRSSEIQNLPESKMPGLVSKIKDQPYNRLMQEKIGAHKKKVSESAQKLAGILELGQGDDEHEGKSFSRSMGVRREEDYEKINSQMESLNNQKQEFMQKINNFAEKLKLL